MSFFQFVGAYWPYFVGILVVSVLIVINEINLKKAKAFYLSVMETLQLSNNGEAVLIDIRNAKEAQKERLPEAINIEYAQLEKKLTNIEQYSGKKIVLYGDNLPRTQQACITLREAHSNAEIYAMEGGIAAWKEANLPTQKGK